MDTERGLALYSITVETRLHLAGGQARGSIAHPLWCLPGKGLAGIPAAVLSRAALAAFKRAYPALSDLEAIFSEGGPCRIEDGEILLFPVRSPCGVFAYITCLENLLQLKRWMSSSAEASLHMAGLDNVSNGQAVVSPNSDILLKNNIVLEEYCFGASASPELAFLAGWLAQSMLPPQNEYAFWRGKLERSLVVLSNDDYAHLLKTCTEIAAPKEGLAETQPNGSGAEYYEYLPADTILTARWVLDLSKAVQAQAATPRDMLEILNNPAAQFLRLAEEPALGPGYCRLGCLPLDGAQAVKFPELSAELGVEHGESSAG